MPVHTGGGPWWPPRAIPRFCVCLAKMGAARRPAKLPIVEKAMVKYGLCLRVDGKGCADRVGIEVAIESFGKILQ
jgi:hypothetical protein